MKIYLEQGGDLHLIADDASLAEHGLGFALEDPGPNTGNNEASFARYVGQDVLIVIKQHITPAEREFFLAEEAAVT